jgi:(p)ppGpp synthase/HD superfamily hydrolase
MLEKRKDLDKKKLLEALSFAKENHIWQTRDEWTPYIIHPISIAIYAMKDWLDTDAVIVCLLHDVVEDTQKDNDYIQNEIVKRFWNNVLFMINKLSKKIGNKKKEIRKYYEEIGNDILLSKIKWFDRLHNIYSLLLQPKKEKVENYIEKTEKEIFPLIYWTETFYNIQSILEIIKKNSENFDIYKERLKNIKKANEIKDKL